MTNDNPNSSVRIGDVTGGIHASIIAGRDVSNAKISLGGQLTPADREPTVDELKQLLAEIRQELAEVIAQKDALQEISAASPLIAAGAEQNVKAAAEAVDAEVEPARAKSLQKSLEEATGLLSGILDGARTVAQKAGEVGEAVKPIAEKLEPLVEKVGVAAFWITKLWLTG